MLPNQMWIFGMWKGFIRKNIFIGHNTKQIKSIKLAIWCCESLFNLIPLPLKIWCKQRVIVDAFNVKFNICDQTWYMIK